SAAKVDVARIALEANARTDISKQRLRILLGQLQPVSGDADLPWSSAFVPQSPNSSRQAARLQPERAYQSAFCRDDKQNSRLRTYFAGKPSANCGAICATGLALIDSAAPFIVIASS